MSESMKLIKRIFFGLVGLILAACVLILICALNPSLTQSLAEQVQTLQQGSAPGTSGVITPENARGEGTLPEAIPGINVNWLKNRETEGYLVPAVMPENLPSEVTGLWGYEPVNGESQQIVQEEADNLSSILTGGEQVAEYDWPVLYYPYYQMLEPDLRRLYAQIYTNALMAVPTFAPIVNVDLDKLDIVFEAVFNDHPELTFLETGYTCLYLEDGTCVEISLIYNEVMNDIETAAALLTLRENEIMEAGSKLGSDFEKVKYVHDLLAESVEYDMNAPMNQSAYSAMVIRRTVCAGYARAFQILMQDLGIPCYYCTGYAGEDHAWNIVLLDGKYYNVDVTWDDMEPLNYDYFNKTDAEFSDTHVRTGLSVYLPACTGTFYGAEALERLEAGTDQPDETQTGDQNADGEQGNQEQTPVRPTLDRPLTWSSHGSINGKDPAADEHQNNLDKAGIDEEDVLDTLKKYYDDCLAQLKEVGVGDKQFSNVVPASLWISVESAYSSGAYWKGYVEDALKELKVENFAIQIQVQNLGGGYYRIYHNVLTY